MKAKPMSAFLLRVFFIVQRYKTIYNLQLRIENCFLGDFKDFGDVNDIKDLGDTIRH